MKQTVTKFMSTPAVWSTEQAPLQHVCDLRQFLLSHVLEMLILPPGTKGGGNDGAMAVLEKSNFTHCVDIAIFLCSATPKIRSACHLLDTEKVRPDMQFGTLDMHRRRR